MIRPGSIYADRVLAAGLLEAGLVRVRLGISDIEGGAARELVEIVMPGDAASHLANMLRTAADHGRQHDEAASAARTTIELQASNLYSVASALGRLVASRPELTKSLDLVERQSFEEAHNTVTEGVAIEAEAAAMRRTIDLIKKLFQDIRAKGPQGDEAEPG